MKRLKNLPRSQGQTKQMSDRERGQNVAREKLKLIIINYW